MKIIIVKSKLKKVGIKQMSKKTKKQVKKTTNKKVEKKPVKKTTGKNNVKEKNKGMSRSAVKTSIKDNKKVVYVDPKGKGTDDEIMSASDLIARIEIKEKKHKRQ